MDFQSYRAWNPNSLVEVRERRQRERQKGNESTKAVLRLWLRILRTHSDLRLSSLSRCSHPTNYISSLNCRCYDAPFRETSSWRSSYTGKTLYITVCEEIRQPQGVIVICRSVRRGGCWYLNLHGNRSHRDIYRHIKQCDSAVANMYLSLMFLSFMFLWSLACILSEGKKVVLWNQHARNIHLLITRTSGRIFMKFRISIVQFEVTPMLKFLISYNQ